MFIQKRYGESKIEACPFCGEQSITTNSQDIPVCMKHKDSLMNEMKCICGEYLETLRGKWGLYFRCQRCGNVNKRKVFEINKVIDMKDVVNETASSERVTEKKSSPPERKEIIITSRDTEWCD
ncbi:hypothetical protein HZC30_06775 [Candidatus Woesearchaeota archaeon]|nr:hypothetical protein [Candidatus Woesearchaeota archaeon]